MSRFSESGWLEGTVEDLADMVRLVSVPQRAVEEAATTLQKGIGGSAKLLDGVNETRSGITMAIARLLGMTNVPQPAAWPAPSLPTPWCSKSASPACMRA